MAVQDEQGINLNTLFDDQEDQPVDTQTIFDDEEEQGIDAQSLFDTPPTQKTQIPQPQNVEAVSPFDFSKEAIGTPLKTGVRDLATHGANVSNMMADWRKRTREELSFDPTSLFPSINPIGAVADVATQALGEEAFDAVTRQIRRFAGSIKTRPSNLPKTEIQSFSDLVTNPKGALEFLEPNRVWETLGKNAPTTGALLLTTALNPAAGVAMAIGLEGGSAHATLEDYEARTGQKIDLGTRIAVPLVVGSVAGSLEYAGVKRIQNVAKGFGGAALTKKLANIGIAAMSEGATEGGQEIVQMAGEASYQGIIPDGFQSRLIQSIYAGVVTGGTLSTASGLLETISHPSPNDASIEGFVDVDGDLQPQFRINKAGHQREGEIVSLEEISNMENVNTPRWQRERLKQQIVRSFPESVEFKDIKADGALILMEARARVLGYEHVDDFIEEHGVVVKKGGRIEQGDLLQAEAFHGSPHDFDQFSTDYIGSGEGFQAFGWGLYFTESQGIAKEYARKLSQNSINVSYKGEIFKDFQSFEDRLFEDFGMENINREYNVRAAQLIDNIFQDSLDPSGNIDIIKAERFREEILGDLRAQIDGARDNVEFHKSEGSNVARLEWEQDLRRAQADFHVLENVDLSELSFNRPQGRVYQVTLNKGKDTSEYKWMPWRDEVSNEDLGIILDHLEMQRIQARRDENLDLNDKLENAIDTITERIDRFEGIGSTVHGAAIYGALTKAFNSPRLASKMLNEAGFSGTKYKANAGQSTSYNYVIFDESIVTIEKKETLFQQEGQRPKGSINFSDGDTVINFFSSADASTLLHEMGHLFHYTLSDVEMMSANDIWDDLTVRENQEKFARQFEQWLGKGGPADMEGSTIFGRFKAWLLDIYGSAINRLGGEAINANHREFFESLFDLTMTEIQTARGPKRTHLLNKWFTSFYDFLDIEGRFERVGFAEVGFHLKNYFSIQGVYQDEGMDVILDIARSVRASKDLDSDAVLLTESVEAMDAILAKPEDERSDVEKAALVIREYLDTSRDEYHARGINIDFAQRLRDELQEKIDKAKEKEETNRLVDLQEQLENAKDLQYTHIPSLIWFRNLMEKDPPRAKRLMVDYMASKKKRETFRISDLIEDGIIKKEEVRSKDIIASYSRQKGRDFALSNIRQAAVAEGAAVPKAAGPKPAGFVEPSNNMQLFKDYYIHNIVYHWVDTEISANLNQNLHWFRRAVNTTKMWAFWNPLFLPMYDVLQSHMAGALNILKPVQSAQLLAGAFEDVMNNTARARAANEHGIRSTPFNSPLEQIGEQFDVAARTHFPAHAGPLRKSVGWVRARGEHALFDVVSKTFKDGPASIVKELFMIKPALRNVYEASWNTAWFLDGLVRQATNNYFLQQGYSPRDAAQLAAEAHADYASIPPSTRKRLNTFLFTPTFKIAMGKWFADSIRANGNLLAGTATRTHRQKAAVLWRTVGILAGFDMFMAAMGFDRDEWGRRYTQRIETETGERELVINWTGPHNLFLKYMQRTDEAFGPEVPNPMIRLYHQNSWEITPLFRIMNSIITNTTPGGDKIWMVSDDPSVKMAKGLTYATTNAINLLSTLVNEDAFGKEGEEAFAREYGQTLSVITKPFVFKYTRQTPDVRMMQKLNTILRIHEEEVEADRLMGEIFRKGRPPAEVIDEYLNGSGVFNTPIEKRSQNLLNRMQKLIEGYEEETWEIRPDTARMNDVPVDEGVPISPDMFD